MVNGNGDTDMGKTTEGENMEKKSRICFGHIKVKCPLDIYVELASVQLHIESGIQGQV